MIRGLSSRHALLGRIVGASLGGFSPADMIGVMQGMPPGMGNPSWPVMQPGAGWPAGMNYQNGVPTVQPRVYPLAVASTGNVVAGTTVTLTAAPQAAFKPQRFIVASNIAPSFTINSIRIGARLQTVDGSETGVPATVYSEVAQNNLMDFDTVQPGITISVRVTNISITDQPFVGTFIGPALIP